MSSVRTHRVIRTIHLWVGAWGAIAAVLFGTTGFMQNHRALLKLPQGDSSEVSRFELQVPEAARVTPEALRTWIETTQHLRLESQRAPPQRPGRKAQARWMLSGGNARTTIQAEYVPGAQTLTLRTIVQSPLATMSRLHKGVGGGIPWILLTDSFALGLIALGVSGLLMWARGRSARKILFSVVGLATVVVVLIGGRAIL